MDMEDGHTFWDVLPTGECFKNAYDILFKGIATKYTSNENKEIVYAVRSNDITFALSTRNKIMHCNREFIRTEHPKLLIAVKDSKLNMYFYETDRVNNDHSVNLDLFTYVNSTFVYIEKHLRKQINNLYVNIITEKCELEKKVIQNSLSIATLAPDEFAYNIMKHPGYIARVAGEVVHLIKCIPKTVKILHLNECYNHLPVLTGNETWFLTPKTYILIKRGIKELQSDCNSIIPTYYKIAEKWIKFGSKPIKTEAPNVLKPNTKIGWTFESIEGLATSRVYSQNDLDKLQQQLMLLIEKASLLNVIAREMAGEHTSGEIFTENTLKHIADSTWHLIIEKLTTWGSFSSAFIMILIILHIGKLIIDTIIRGYTLHTIYGWSIYLIGALFSSITHLLTSLQNNPVKNECKNYQKRNAVYEETELQEVEVIPVISRPIQPPPIPHRPPSVTPTKPTIPDAKNKGIFSLNLD
ncbi:phosphoglycerate mutase family member 5 isoform X1 [Nasonia vitripennis]|uniref:Uncharacterized protein n=1 Tax=Nasonia vitripennis TaxID=7425 RepID=A0A7M7Q3H9_NASVI|nr:phosphoglycerate mutase family member 5 isoform X1 [Nasonia vitripennis]